MITCIFQVERKTNHKIKDLLSSDSVDSNTRLVLINALYFKVNILTYIIAYQFSVLSGFDRESDRVQFQVSYK